jgi:hypothetical protein
MGGCLEKVVSSRADLHNDRVDLHHVRSSRNVGMTQGSPDMVACWLCHRTHGPAAACPHETHDG